MKKSLILSALAVLMLTACQNNGFKVTGDVSEGAKYVYYVNDFTADNPPIDSVEVVDGKFVIEGVVDTAYLATATSDQNDRWWFIVEPGEVKLEAEGKVSGTPQNDALNEFMQFLQTCENEDSLVNFCDEFMAKHPNDLAGAFAMLNLKDYLGLNVAAEKLEKCGDVVKDLVYKFTPKEEFEKAKLTGEGKPFVDFEAEYDGIVQKLSDYVGKGQYVLVDFWASWCGPCREEIPTVKELYEKYAGEQFTVLGVATWDQPEDTKKAIEELGIMYPQIMNAQKAGSDAYGINGIPEIILFAPDGTILKRGLRGEAMVKAVEEALGVTE